MRKRRILSWMLAAVMAFSLLPAAAQAAKFPGSGRGTAANPYVITTEKELNAVRENLRACYKLGRDIHLSGTAYAKAWLPIGTFRADAEDPSGETPDAAYAFSGTFDGNGKTVTGLNISDGAACTGLFGVVANGTVKNLTVKNAAVSGNTMTAGAIGYAYHATVDNVDLTGVNTITGTLSGGAAPSMVAGIVGAGMDSVIAGCDVTGTSLKMKSADGAAAWGGNVHDTGLVGGGLEGCNLKNCSARDSSVTVGGSYCFGIGGLSGCAVSADSITGCTVKKVTVTVGDHAYLVGGLTGYTGQDGDHTATAVSGCSADTDIRVGTNSSRIGGLIGGGFYLDVYKAYYPVPTRFTLTNCTAAGTISAGNGSEAIGSAAGYACLCDTAGGTGKMAGAAGTVGTEQAPFAGGSGTEKDPYLISSAAQLYAVRYDLNAHYKLTADIDLAAQLGEYYTQALWRPIGVLTYSTDVNMTTGEMKLNKAFSGTFDGGGKTISNVKAASDGDMLAAGGLFACVTGTVKDLTVRNATVTGGKTNRTAGGVVGYAMGGSKISNVTLTGANTITGINCVGGIAGGSETADISGCTVTGTKIVVTGDNHFNAADSKTKGRIIQCDTAECGGLIVGGGFGGSVKNCTASGTVTASGNEPVGLGGIGGCLQCMGEISGNTATVTITTSKGGHAIGGLCGFAGRGDDGSGNKSGSYKESDRTADAPCEIKNCTVNAVINAPGATHVGGLVGTGLYYYGMEDRFRVTDCVVTGSITAGTEAGSPYGASVPGAVAGRAVGSSTDGCTFAGLQINGTAATNKVGVTGVMYESADQYQSTDGTDGGALLHSLSETYQPLFEGATFQNEYDGYWHDYCAAIVGEANADATVKGMKSSVGGKLYGADAVSAYAADPQSARFFCGFTGDLATLTFNGSRISGCKKDGTELFSHAYRYIGYKTSTDQNRFSFYVYESLDGNAGEYRYFLMCPDTPDTTHHIEFRYGSDLDALLKLYTGKNAYWLAAGIPTSAMQDPKKSEVEQTIALFCLENMDYTAARTSASLAQIRDLTGTWVYYADGKAQPDTLYFSVDAKGNGRSYAQGKEASHYQVFAYDNDGSGSKKSGIYVSNSGESKWAKYSITTSGAGKTILTLTGEEDGKPYEISYLAAGLPFKDVPEAAWYYDSAVYAYDNGLFSGTSASTFSPNATMTRQALWMVLARMDGKTPATMTAARTWAMNAGISDGAAPANTVTRQQLAVILYRYAQYKKYETTQSGTAVRKFADYGEVSQYALSGMAWAVNAGLMQGSENRVMPFQGATRAQTAVILQRMSKVQTK